MSLSDYKDFVYRAGHIHSADPVKHWQKVHRQQKRLVRILSRLDKLHIQGPGTDLKLRVKGRRWVNCAGTENFPDGEIFTSPIEDSANGVIRFTYPAVYGGREVEDVCLEFKKGRVRKETARKNNWPSEKASRSQAARIRVLFTGIWSATSKETPRLRPTARSFIVTESSSSSHCYSLDVNQASPRPSWPRTASKVYD
jgi:hypothetical protein